MPGLFNHRIQNTRMGMSLIHSRISTQKVEILIAVYIPDPEWDPQSGEARLMVPCMRIKEHPLISRAIQLAKSIGINLSEFKLTPKSADEKQQVSGHLIVEHQLDMKQVIIVSPTTFTAYLQSVLYGFKAFKIETSAKEIRGNVEKLSKHLRSYQSYFQKLGKSLGTTVSHYESAGKEFGKIDKDVMKISDSSIGADIPVLTKPHVDEEQ